MYELGAHIKLGRGGRGSSGEPREGALNYVPINEYMSFILGEGCMHYKEQVEA